MSNRYENALTAAAAAQSHLERTFPGHLRMRVVSLRPLSAKGEWLAQFQSQDYLDSGDPMDFVVTPAAWLRADLSVETLPTSVPVEVALSAHHRALAPASKRPL